MVNKRPYVRLIITDVDGTLTDGTVTYYDDGSTSRIFSTLDGRGFYLAELAKVPVIFMSGSNSPEIMHRAKYLKCHYYLGILDKYAAVQMVSELSGVDLADICFLGNDTNDIDALSTVGYPACPRNAHPLILHTISEREYGFISTENGGHGAFRDLIDFLMLHNFNPIKRI